MKLKGYIAISMLTGALTGANAAALPASTVNSSVDIQQGDSHMKDLQLLRDNYKLENPKAGETEINTALMSTKLLMLKRVNESTVTGSNIWKEKLTLQQLRDIARNVRALAAATFLKKDGAAGLLDLYLDFLFSQKVFNRIPKIQYSNYSDVRKIPADFLSAVPVCNDVRKAKVIAAVQDLLEFNVIRQGDEAVKKWISSDYLYNALPHVFLCALYQPDTNKAVQDMEAVSRFLSTCTAYTEGGHDILKPDGTGFHHNSHYNGYMYSYRTWVDYIWRFKGTAFRIDKASYERLKKAVVSIYLMSTRSTKDGEHFFANSMAGRHPFTGLGVAFSKELFEKLIEIGGDVSGQKYDLDLAACYNYFFKASKYGVAEKKADGFYQFNYSPAGVYRKDNWVAVMRSPTTKFWGAEIYNKTNRFGRYQSHGTLEVLYEGDLSASGYPSDAKTNGGGWDWNMMPGSTTVHYTDWKAMMPAQDDKERFDQFASASNFAGALSWGNSGLFGASFDQSDKWGSKVRFEATNLTFRKSVVCMDGMLFSMGSAISAKGDYPDAWLTATNLFQTVASKKYATLMVNGEELKKNKDLKIASEQAAWIVTPVGTGFFIPKAHDELVISYKKQKTPSSPGLAAPENDLLVAKAFLNHGVKPSGKSYSFLEVPATDAVKMKDIADKQASGNLFKALATDTNYHIVEYVPSKTIAYTFFSATMGLSVGTITGTSSELLAMEKEDNGVLKLALCNPDLRPVTTEGRLWKPTSAPCTVTLKGKWQLNEAVDGLSVSSTTDGHTELKMVFSQGNPIYVSLKNH